MPKTIEVKLKGCWVRFVGLSTEDDRGYLICKFDDGQMMEFRPVEWRILED